MRKCLAVWACVCEHNRPWYTTLWLFLNGSVLRTAINAACKIFPNTTPNTHFNITSLFLSHSLALSTSLFPSLFPSPHLWENLFNSLKTILWIFPAEWPGFRFFSSLVLPLYSLSLALFFVFFISSLKLTCIMLSELLENEVLSVVFYGEETDWNSGCVFSDAY